MSDFAVRPSALLTGAGGFGRLAEQSQSATAQIVSPDTGMFGIFLEPLMSAVLAPITDGARAISQGVGHAHQVVGEQLRSTAQSYQDMEDYASELCRSIVEDL